VSGSAEAELRLIADELPDQINTSDRDDDGTWYHGSLSGWYLKGLARKELGRRGDAAEWQRWIAAVLEAAGVERSVEPLLAALKHEREDVREAGAWALGETRASGAAAPLATALADSDGAVRHAAGEALLRLGPAGIDALAAALAHEFKRTRVAAIRALGRLEDPRVSGLLAGAMHDPARDVREAVAQVLARWHDPDAS